MVRHYDTAQWSPYSTNSKFLVEVACPVGCSSGLPKELIREQGFWCRADLPVCITQRESTSPSPPSLPLKQERWRERVEAGLTEGAGGGLRSVDAHLQEVILNVAVESAAQPHRVVLPQFICLQVKAKLLPAVLQTQAECRPHLEEHGWQLLDVEDVCKRCVTTVKLSGFFYVHLLKSLNCSHWSPSLLRLLHFTATCWSLDCEQERFINSLCIFMTLNNLDDENTTLSKERAGRRQVSNTGRIIYGIYM